MHLGAPVACNAADVMSGDQGGGAKFPRSRQKIHEFDPLVAANTGNGRGAGQIIVDKFIDHGGAKSVLIIQHIMGDAQTIGHLPGVMDVGAGATGAGPLDSLAMIVELQGNTDHFITGPLAQSRTYGGIHAAGHGDDNTRPIRHPVQAEALGDHLFRYLCGYHGRQYSAIAPGSKGFLGARPKLNHFSSNL